MFHENLLTATKTEILIKTKLYVACLSVSPFL